MPSPTSVSVLSVQTLSTTSFPSQALSPWSLMSSSLSLDLLFILTTISIFCFPHNSVSISSTSLLVQTLFSSFWVSIEQLLTGLPTFLFASCESFLHLGYNDLAETRWGNGAFFHSTPIYLDRHVSLISWHLCKAVHLPFMTLHWSSLLPPYLLQLFLPYVTIVSSSSYSKTWQNGTYA